MQCCLVVAYYDCLMVVRVLHVFWFGCLVFIVCIVLLWLFVFRWLLVVLNLMIVCGLL